MTDDRRPDLRSLWDFDDPAGSEARFRDLAAGTTGTERDLVLTQVARALGLQDRFDEARAVLGSLTGDDEEVRVRTALETGRLLRSSGDPLAAGPHFTDAARLAEEAGLEELHVDALHMLAIVAPPEEQEARTLAALDVARSASDPRARDWDASLLNNLGMTYADRGDFTAALEAFEDARSACERIGDPGRTRIARWMVAWALRNLGRTQEAREIQLALRDELRAAGETDVYVEEELALLESSDASGSPSRSEGGTVDGYTG